MYISRFDIKTIYNSVTEPHHFDPSPGRENDPATAPTPFLYSLYCTVYSSAKFKDSHSLIYGEARGKEK
jgi:hypothetical protein